MQNLAKIIHKAMRRVESINNTSDCLSQPRGLSAMTEAAILKLPIVVSRHVAPVRHFVGDELKDKSHQ